MTGPLSNVDLDSSFIHLSENIYFYLLIPDNKAIMNIYLNHGYFYKIGLTNWEVTIDRSRVK